MEKYFVRDTPLADLERMMMQPPDFAPRGSSSAILKCGCSKINIIRHSAFRQIVIS